MKVFISWSGRRSHEVAEALSTWLKKVIQSADPWVSSDMERGVKWLAEIGRSLDSHSIGILCVTPGNVGAPWLNFEAGALSKQIGDDVRVIPYLLDFKSAGDLQPPLGQFNASLSDEAGTLELVKTLNAHSDTKLSEENLVETFRMWWPGLRDQLRAIRDSGTGQPPERRTTDDKIDELLELTRQLSRTELPSWSRLSTFADAIVDARNKAAHGQDDLGGGLAMHGEGTLSVGLPPQRTASTLKETISGVVDIMLRQAGLDVSAMSVVEADLESVDIYVPHSIHNSVLQRVRDAILTTVSPKRVQFFTRGDYQEMETIDPDHPSEPYVKPIDGDTDPR